MNKEENKDSDKDIDKSNKDFNLEKFLLLIGFKEENFNGPETKLTKDNFDIYLYDGKLVRINKNVPEENKQENKSINKFKIGDIVCHKISPEQRMLITDINDNRISCLYYKDVKEINQIFNIDVIEKFREKRDIIIIDVKDIPVKYGFDVDKFLHYIKEYGIAFIDKEIYFGDKEVSRSSIVHIDLEKYDLTKEELFKILEKECFQREEEDKKNITDLIAKALKDMFPWIKDLDDKSKEEPKDKKSVEEVIKDYEKEQMKLLMSRHNKAMDFADKSYIYSMDFVLKDLYRTVKFDIDEEVWFIRDNRIHRGNIIRFSKEKKPTSIFIYYIIQYKKESGNFDQYGQSEDVIFRTKEELVEFLNKNVK